MKDDRRNPTQAGRNPIPNSATQDDTSRPAPPMRSSGGRDQLQSERSLLPTISLPKGGGAIRGIGEKFSVNAVTGTGSLSVPIPTSPGRAGFGPQLVLTYDSGAGNGPFGLGFQLSVPNITRKTDKGLPRYEDAHDSDTFILSGAEDLVPARRLKNGAWKRDTFTDGGETVDRYRPRVEGLFARIERRRNTLGGDAYWVIITKDNIRNVYGKSPKARIFDPEHPSRIFSWLLEETRDDRGNVARYTYKAEDDEGVDPGKASESNRFETRADGTRRFLAKAQRYLKRIQYGNRAPLDRADPAPSSDEDWLFEVVFDYGEHDDAAPSMTEPRPWPCRPDAFSTYRAGFEVRTYRLCRRVLMFHRIAELGATPCLVGSTDFTYAPTPVLTQLTAVTHAGYVRDPATLAYTRKAYPPLEFGYSSAELHTAVQVLDQDTTADLPAGVQAPTHQWVDLDGEGIPGVLSQQGTALFYKRNEGNGKLAPARVLTRQPAMASLAAGGQQLLDIDGDGRKELVVIAPPASGYHERTENDGWGPFHTFAAQALVDFQDPNLRLIDLSGDGHDDILIARDDVFIWFPSLAKGGFGKPITFHKPRDEDKGAALVFADGTQSIFLADMAGDGLTGIVRIRNGSVCYWPNLGYGRFGVKVTMDGHAWFDNPDMFDPARIRLADVDGSGTTDILYIHRDGTRIYANQAGNSLAAPVTLPRLPDHSNLSSIAALDVLGTGTACLVWSSPLPGTRHAPIRYIDLLGSTKPHLLTSVTNNLGLETRLRYAPSTKFYLADRAAGRPWITRLPFPVQVLERVESYDHISRVRFVSEYRYHHGYFDGPEREFRGFGMVEQQDTKEFAALSGSDSFPVGDNIDAASHVPPVLTKTWFHTGMHVGRERVSNYFAGLLDNSDPGEYYREPGWTEELLLDDTVLPAEFLLNDTVVPASLTAEEEREACRALKGSMLRQEVYALDGTDREQHPYTVTEQNLTVRLLQPRGDNRHAVVFTHAREALSHHYERSFVPVLDGQIVDEATAGTNPEVEWLADPRVGHTLTLEVDNFGNVLKSADVGYGRRFEDLRLPSQQDRDKQTQVFITYTENEVTNAVDTAGEYRTPLPSESRTYELTGLGLPAGHHRFTFQEVIGAGAAAGALYYEATPTPGAMEKRLIEHVRTLYRRDDLNGPLPLGDLESLALPFESYKLAFTPGLIAQVYDGRVSNPMLEEEARYLHSEGDANWWIPAGQVFYSPNTDDSPAQELAYARQHFFLPHRYRDPFHTAAVRTETFVTYDSYDLLVQETRDALGNRVTVGERDIDPTQPLVRQGQDYRVLQPALIMDPNRNRAAVAFDALGMVVGTAVMGKPKEDPVPGDRLTTAFRADLTQAEIDEFFANPKGQIAGDLLGEATTRIVYDLTGYWREPDRLKKRPAVVATLARETHASEPVPAGGLQIQVSFLYSDGSGREVQKKIQVEPGPVPRRDAAGKIIVGADGLPEMTPDEVSPRWVGSGWTVFNNKGKPVRQYEPFFTDTHRFEFEVRIGVSPVIFYDPVERVVATLHPNHTWEKVVFDPWRQETWDVSDTVLVADPASDSDVGDFFNRLPEAEYLPTWYAQRQDGALGPQERAAARKTAVHAATPTVAHADSLGRTFLTVAHNKFKYSNTPAAEPPVEECHGTRVVFDIEGNQREVIDALGRVVMRYDYDMLGNRIHQASMEAGARWMLNDVAGKPLYAWDSRDHRFRTAYDVLRRPTDSFLREGTGTELLVGRSVYGESLPNPEDSNARGKVVRVFDQAGVVVSEDYDFKGNALSSSRQLAQEYKATLDWSGDVPLEPDVYASEARYDALNRPIEITSPDGSVTRPGYNEVNLLERIEVNLRGTLENGEPVWTPFVTDIDYDAKGQRTLIDYGNGVRTTCAYDPLTFRLMHLLTRRNAVDFPDDCPQPPPAGWPGCQVQNLHYTYDPLGNITHIHDDAQQTIYFRNKRVEPSADYTYDAVYRLIEATGREHLGQVGGAPVPSSYNDKPRVGILFSANDGNAMGCYLQRYAYDAVGNFREMIHRGSDPAHPGWTRAYAYDESSLLEPSKQSNRLTSTTIGATMEVYSAGGNGYDAHGNMLRMPHLQIMQWDFEDQLKMTQRQAVNADDEDGVQRQGERTWYVYDAGGQRVRKVTEFSTGQVKDERVYLGSLEIYRKHGADPLVRETLHIMDDQRRIALVETRTRGNEPGVPPQLIRYQFGNHLGSASLELDEQAQIISYEEYTPYGSSAYQALRSQTEAPKRYRYTGKERDEETGLYYHGARYYAPSLGRWTSADPAGAIGGWNLLNYCHSNPIAFQDPNGCEPVASEDKIKSLVKALTSSKNEAAKAAPEAPVASKPAQPLLKVIDREIGTVNGKPTPPAPPRPGELIRAPQPYIQQLLSSRNVSIAPTIRAATAQERTQKMTFADLTNILSKMRSVPGYGLGVAGAAALDQKDPRKLDAAGNVTSSALALGQITAATRAYAQAKKESASSQQTSRQAPERMPIVSKKESAGLIKQPSGSAIIEGHAVQVYGVIAGKYDTAFMPIVGSVVPKGTCVHFVEPSGYALRDSTAVSIRENLQRDPTNVPVSDSFGPGQRLPLIYIASPTAGPVPLQAASSSWQVVTDTAAVPLGAFLKENQGDVYVLACRTPAMVVDGYLMSAPYGAWGRK